MATLISNNNFSLNDISDVGQAINYAATNPSEKPCGAIRNYLAQVRNWKIYRFLVVEQVNWEEDFAINGPSTHAVWKFNNRFYSVIWMI